MSESIRKENLFTSAPAPEAGSSVHCVPMSSLQFLGSFQFWADEKAEQGGGCACKLNEPKGIRRVRKSVESDWATRSIASHLLERGLGAGTAVPSVRHFSQRVVDHCGGRLVRVNPNAFDVPTPLDVGLAMGAADGLAAMAKG